VQGVKEILATDEAVIYRHFIEGSGARSIAVGYPEKGNLSFDAATMRLAMIWHGPFIDGARHSSGRGQGFEPPLGHNRLSLPVGPPLAFLPDQNVPWPETVGKTGGFEFKGYRLDKKRRPTFMYRFRNIDVEDYPMAVGTELDAKFLRSIRFKSKSDVVNVWMKVAEGDSINQRGDGVYVVDGRLQISFKGEEAAMRPLVRSIDGVAELLVPIDFVKGEAVIEMELVW
jgi:hypothetical protein